MYRTCMIMMDSQTDKMDKQYAPDVSEADPLSPIYNNDRDYICSYCAKSPNSCYSSECVSQTFVLGSCEFGVAKCKDPSLDIASLGHCENGQTTVTTTISSTTVTTTISSPPTTTMSTTTMTTTPTTTATKPPQTRPPSNNPTTMGPEHDLFCDNKDAIQCPSTVDYVCASDGVLYKNR